MVDLPIDGLKAAALAATPGPEHIYTHPRDSNNCKANEWFHHNCYPQHVLELIERLERSEQKATIAERLGQIILTAKNEWADRAAKAEALTKGALSKLDAKPGDVVIWRTNDGVGAHMRRDLEEAALALKAHLPDGCKVLICAADHLVETMSDELLDGLGLMRKPSIDHAFFDTKLGRPYEAACPSSLHDGEPQPDAGWVTSMIPEGESLQDGLDALVVRARRNCDEGEV